MRQSISKDISTWLEVVAVAATGVLYLVCQSFGAKGLYITLASFSWTAYIIWRVRLDANLWEKWGFHTKNLLAAFFWPTIFFLLGVSLMAWYGLAHGRVLWQKHLVMLLLLYPFWGILQQFLVQALGVSNLMMLFPRQGWCLAMPVGMFLFSLVHYPDGWLLMIATGFMACFFIPCYLRDRNLWPLGLYHGWLGTLFYLWVLGRDPWMEAYGR